VATQESVLLTPIEPADEEEWLWLRLVLRHTENAAILVAVLLIVTTFYGGGPGNALCLAGLFGALLIDHRLSHQKGFRIIGRLSRYTVDDRTIAKKS